jgi:hypothetical protein
MPQKCASVNMHRGKGADKNFKATWWARIRNQQVVSSVGSKYDNDFDLIFK